MFASLSPLMVAPTLPTAFSSSASPASTSLYNKTNPSSSLSPSAHQTTCRVIVGPSDSEYITVIIGPHTTVLQLKQDAIKHIAARDHLSASDTADQYMIVRRINPRALMQANYGTSMNFLPHVSAGLLSSASPFNTMVPGFTPPFSPNSTQSTAGTSSAMTPMSVSRPAPPSRVAPRKPASNADSPVTTAPTSPTSASAALATNSMLPPMSSSSATSSAATSPRTTAPVTAEAPSLSFPLSMFSGGGTLMRLDDNDIIYGRHDDTRYDLMLERLTDDVHIRLSIDDEQQQQNQQHGGTTTSQLPLPGDIDRTQSHELASRLAPSSSPTSSASSVFSFPLGQRSTSATPSAASTSTQSAALGATITVDMAERESELSAGLDVCLMSMHGTYLQSPACGDLRVACLDNCATFTLVDSAACDENGQCYRYLRTDRGEYLAADARGTLYLHDINQPRPVAQSPNGKEEEEKTAVEDRSELGLLTRNHRWTIKRGAVQSLVSAHSHYLTIAEEGDITLTPVRYEESCVHICFAILQGGLRKKQDSGMVALRRWQHKWFVLSGSTLTFYEQQDDIYNRDNNAAIASKLKQQQQSNKLNSSDSGNTYSTAGILSINVHPAPSCRFDVEFVNGRVLEVKADSEDERERWVAALRNGKVGKKMDAKAKEGKKKKERQQTLRQKQTVAANSINKQRWDADEKMSSDQPDLSPTSPTSASLAASNGIRKQPPPLRIQTEAAGSSTPSHSTFANDEKQPLAITITHHLSPAIDSPSAATSANESSAGGSVGPPAGHAHTPSFTSSPELSQYRSSAANVSPLPLSAVGSSSQSQSGRSTPLSASQHTPALTMANTPAAAKRRSLSIG